MFWNFNINHITFELHHVHEVVDRDSHGNKTQTSIN